MKFRHRAAWPLYVAAEVPKITANVSGRVAEQFCLKANATAARTKAANRFNITGAPEGFFVQFEKADGKIKNLTLVQGPRSSLVL